MEKGCEGISGRWRAADSEKVPGWGTGEPWEGREQERPWTEGLEEEDGKEGMGPRGIGQMGSGWGAAQVWPGEGAWEKEWVWGCPRAQCERWRGKGMMFREGPQGETIEGSGAPGEAAWRQAVETQCRGLQICVKVTGAF